MLSVMLTLMLGGVLVAMLVVDSDMRADPFTYGVALAPPLLRLSWLAAVGRGRSGQSEPLSSPVRLPVTGRVAVARRAEPAVALGLLIALLVPVWYRQARDLQAVLAEDAAQRRVTRWTAPRPLLALGALVAATPGFNVLMLSVRGVRLLMSGGRAGVRPAVLLLAVAASGVAAMAGLVLSVGATVMEGLALTWLMLAAPVCMGVSNVAIAQRLRELGSPLPSSGEPVEGDRVLPFATPPGWPASPANWLPGPEWRPDEAWPAAPARWRYLRPAHQKQDEPVEVRLPDPRAGDLPLNEASLPR